MDAVLATHLFLGPKVKCPVCKQEFRGTEVNPRLYSAAERESDRHVTRYNWTQGIKTDVRPHHYDVWHCPNCLYTALRGEFSLTSTTSKHRTRWSAYQQLPTGDQLKIRQLAAQLLLAPPWDETTVTILTALGLWIQNLVDEENRSWMEVGKLYLRLAWRYRETPIMALQGEEVKITVSQGQRDLQEACTQFAESLTLLNQRLTQLKLAIEQRHRETGKEVYATLLDSLNQKVHTLTIPEKTLEKVLQRDLAHGLGGSETQASARFPLQSLGHTIAQFWPEFPTSETAATLACVDALDKGLRTGEGGDLSVDAQLNVITVNIRLLERINDFRRALQYITDISKMAFSERQDLTRRIRDLEKQDKGPDAKRPLVRQLNSVNAIMQSVSTMRTQLMEAMIAKEGEEGRRYLEEKGWLFQ